MAKSSLNTENGYKHGTIEIVKVDDAETSVKVEFSLVLETGKTEEFKSRVEELMSEYVL